MTTTTVPVRSLSGAALAAHERRVAYGLARSAIRRRDPESVRDTVAFLRAALPEERRTAR